jgi:hypothetical protein
MQSVSVGDHRCIANGSAAVFSWADRPPNRCIDWSKLSPKKQILPTEPLPVIEEYQ